MIRVLIVDDSPLMRKIATDILQSDPLIEVVGTASSGEIALRKITKLNPDVVTMDIEMPGLGGIETIKEIMLKKPTPIIVMSAFAQRGAELTMKALELGAVDFLAKPQLSLSGGIKDISSELISKVKQAKSIKLKKLELQEITESWQKIETEQIEVHSSTPFVETPRYDLVAIGTSTGGPVALKTVLSSLPGDFPVGIVIVQHMPPLFTKAFAARLDTICRISVKEATDGDPIVPGRALIAPGDYHMTVIKQNTKPRVLLHRWSPVSGHRPSVDVLMHSVAREYGSKAIGVIMTGMGKDGAEGIGELKESGGYVIAQDKDSSVIFGMNREVIQNGDADEVIPLEEIVKRIVEQLSRNYQFNNTLKGV